MQYGAILVRVTARLDERTLNLGLGLAMEFGDEWLRPIQQRLARQLPDLEQSQLDACDRTCREVMKLGHERAVECVGDGKRSQEEAFRLFAATISASYPWVSDANLSRLFSQGCYYAYKDGWRP